MDHNPNAFPRNRAHDENIARYLKDCQDGRYDRYQDAVSRTYLTECRIFWDGIRYYTARVTRDYMCAISRLSEPDTKSPETNSAVTYRDRHDNDTQPDDRGANVMMEELDNTNPIALPDSKKSKRSVPANIKRGIRLADEKKKPLRNLIHRNVTSWRSWP